MTKQILDTLSDKIELVSKDYELTHEIDRNSDWFLLKLHEELGELTQAYLLLNGQAKSKNRSADELQEKLTEELADVFCHVLLFARNNNIDVINALEKKWFKHLPKDSL